VTEFQSKPRSALDGLLQAGHYGQAGQEPEVTLAERREVSAFMILARQAQEATLRDRMAAIGLDLPARPQQTEARNLTLVWTGPGQWLALCRSAEAPQARRRFEPLAALCTLVQADDARTILIVSGPKARETLAKLLPIDLHPRVFHAGDAAVTTAAGIPTLIWQADDNPTFEIAVPRSLAASFWHGLSDAAAEFGYRVTD
jgi:methylglutamate dehydrogenase subunit D